MFKKGHGVKVVALEQISQCLSSVVSSFEQPQNLNPQVPVAQKIADEFVFRRFQGEGVEF